MNVQALQDELNRLLAGERRSLLRHLNEATPYLTPRTYPIWNDIQHLAQVRAAHEQRLSELLARLRLADRPLPFDPHVANHHYTDLAYMLPLLVEEQQNQIAACQRAIEHATEDPDLRAELQTLLDDHQAQLDKLQSHLQTLLPETRATAQG